MIAELAALAAAMSAQTAPVPMTTSELDGHIAEQVRAASRRWGVSPTLRLDDGDRIISSPLGRITIGREAIRRALGSTPPDQARLVVSWIVWHEVWHQVVFRDFGVEAPEPAASRLVECAADAMAANAVLEAELSTRRLGGDDDASRSLTAAIGRIIETAENLEVGFNGALDHPTADQRRHAIRFGFGRAIHTVYYEVSTSPTRGLERDRTGRIYDVRQGESDVAWSTRICRHILHAGDGIGDLVAGEAVINWNRTADNPIVDYRFPYSNRGSAPIRVSMQIRSVSVPRISREDAGSWLIADVQTYQFDLAPGQSYTVAGRLTWYATDAALPRILRPPDPEAVFDVERLAPPAAAGIAVPAEPIGLTPDLRRLLASIQSIAVSALDEFDAVVRNCETYRGSRTCELNIQVPGVTESIVEMDSGGSSEVVMTVFEGESDQGAHAAYVDFRQRLRAIFPAKEFVEQPERDGRRTVSFSPSVGARLELRKSRATDGTYRVRVIITPVRF